MICTLSRLFWFGMLGLVWLVLSEHGQAWERCPLKINTHWEFRVDVSMGPDFRRPTAPWYAYFPVDPRMSPSAQISPYPPFPAQFPPRTGPAGTLPTTTRPINTPPSFGDAPSQAQYSGLPRDAQMFQVWQSPNAQGMNLQPIGYVPAQTPSYWYRNP